MKLLLDTQAFIWWDSDPGRLSAAALAALHDPANAVWFRSGFKTAKLTGCPPVFTGFSHRNGGFETAS
jgi:hypothetical protein